jgi:hypothetical protein
MSAMWRWAAAGILLLWGLSHFGGCSKEASFEPLFEINPGDRLRSDTLLATQSAWFNKGASAGPAYLSGRVVVGNWAGYDSRGFLRFTAFPETSSTVDTVLLYLWANLVEGNPGTVIDVHTLVDTLEQDDLFWGTMPGISEDPIASFTVPPAPDSVFVDITPTATSWIKRRGHNYGLALKAHDETGAEFLVEFTTRETATKAVSDSTVLDLRPDLRIAYVDDQGEAQRAVSIAAEDTFADTLVTPFPPDDAHLLCGRGFPSRAFVKFDIDRIPAGSTVTKSVMRLTADVSASSFDSIGIAAYAVLDTGWTGFDTKLGSRGTSTVTLEIGTVTTDNVVDMDVTALVQPLVARLENNAGFAIRAPNETYDLDFVGFWSNYQPDSVLSPRLVVDYVIAPALPDSEDIKP